MTSSLISFGIALALVGLPPLDAMRINTARSNASVNPIEWAGHFLRLWGRGEKYFNGYVKQCPDSARCTDELRGLCKSNSTAKVECPQTCDTAYGDAWCVRTMSPCAAVPPCYRGWRPVKGCKESKCNFPWLVKSEPWCRNEERILRRSQCMQCTEEPGDDRWEPVSEQLRCLTVGVTIGTSAGQVYKFDNKKMLSERRPAASNGKFPAAVAIVRGTVAKGLLTFDTLASDVFDWWTSDPTDMRSRVTLRHMLTLSSGFESDMPGPLKSTHDVHKVPCIGSPYVPYIGYANVVEECARQVYEKASHKYEPGQAFQYNSYHLVLALAVACKTTGLPWWEFMKTNLLEPANMTNTVWGVGWIAVPNLAASMQTTGYDYDSFLQRYTSYKLIPKDIADQMEVAYQGSWAMSHEINRDCHQLAGQFRACINRKKGTYILVIPPKEDYMAPGYAQQWHGPVNEQTLWWIKDQAEVLALSA